MIAVKDKIIISVLVDEAEEVLESGLILTNKVDQIQTVGQVLSAGEDVPGIKEGDVIICSSHAGQPIKVEGKAFRVIAYSDVLGLEVMK